MRNEGMGVLGLGRADLGEQGQCLLPVGQGGVRSLWVERVAEDQQDVGLAEAVNGVALDRQGLPCAAVGLVEVVEVLVGGGQAEQRGDRRVRTEPAATAELLRACGRQPPALRIAAAALAGQPRRSIASYAGQVQQAIPDPPA